MQPGDAIGFSGANPVSDAINFVTLGLPRWSLSHVAVVRHDGRSLVESTTLDDEPCIVTGRCLKGVQAHWIDERVASYEGRVWHYPLTRSLYPHELHRFDRFLASKIGLPYDEIGATRCVGLIWPLIESRLHDAGRASLFCSELVAMAFNEIGVFPTAYRGRWSPNHLVREMRAAGLLKKPIRLK